MLGSIRASSTDGIPFDEILHKLVQRQSNAMIDSTMGGSQVQDDTELGSLWSEDDQEVRSTEAMHPQFGQEAEEKDSSQVCWEGTYLDT